MTRHTRLRWWVFLVVIVASLFVMGTFLIGDTVQERLTWPVLVIPAGIAAAMAAVIVWMMRNARG